MKNGNTPFDFILVFFDDLDGFLSFFPGFCRVAEDKKGVGYDVEFISPLDEVVEIVDVDFFVDDLVPDPF
jgi:hypothetical protein